MKGRRLRLTAEETEHIYKLRAKIVSNVNENSNIDKTAYLEYLEERGIDQKDVASVKFWQSAGGEPRYSIVTKNQKHTDTDKIFGDVVKLIEQGTPDVPKIKGRKSGSHLLVINPADIHIGKYATRSETGEDYNTPLACQRVIEGVIGILEKSKGFDIDRILFCIGNDILHIDSTYNTTTKGTPQDVDSKWHEMYVAGLELYIQVVEILRKVAPVDCVHSMSNHDYVSGFHLAQSLKAWYRNTNDVMVDATPNPRKYYKWNSSLIGLAHGDGAKADGLPLLMANEHPEAWASTRYRYWYLHHLHHKVKYKYLDAKDYAGVTLEYLRSPSSADSWHHRKGFTGAPKAVEGFIHSEFGQIARITHIF
tara:strand:- start:26 stop:1120 length:1095 start_codon:yes stop_codon:yes gene_type:complete